MANDRSASQSTRRGFLTRAGGALAVSALGDHPSEASALPDPADKNRHAFRPIKIPDWVHGVTRMAFLTPGEVPKAAKAGAEVIHTNLIWPYFPLRRDGGGLSRPDARKTRDLVAACHRHGMKLVLGLPPFPSVALMKEHPSWRIHPTDSAAALTIVPLENNLGTRLACNLGPWGDYLIDLCGELVADYQIDGFSFDGNYHPPICYCPACKTAYKRDQNRQLPDKVSLDHVAYREYLVWRGERLENHYARLQERIKKANPDAVLMSWTVNAGRYGHFLYSPRAMPTRLNLLFDLPMQEWWLDETNVGASLIPAFGAAYLRATTGGRPCAAEPYLMSRGNPYGTDSFPAHERLTRCLLAIASGNILAESLGWPGHDVAADFAAVGRRAPFITRTQNLPWAALLVSEQTRQFYAYKDIADRFLAPVVGAFRAATEEHLPLTLVNDWDLDIRSLERHDVVVLPCAAAMSEAQADALRQYVKKGGGLVVTGETSLCDELGRPRRDFALADLFGVSYRGRPQQAKTRPVLDENFAIAIDENYWKQRIGVGTLLWRDHPLTLDAKLNQLVPGRSVIFRGPQVLVTEPERANEVAIRLKPEGHAGPPVPAVVARSVGKGRVVYFAAGIDAALWSYAYPYQRRLLARALAWAARVPVPISVRAPMCVHATFFTQSVENRRRLVVHLFNGTNTTANHGLPAMDVPLREETIPVHGIEITFNDDLPKKVTCQPGNRKVNVRRHEKTLLVEVPPLTIHSMIVGEY